MTDSPPPEARPPGLGGLVTNRLFLRVWSVGVCTGIMRWLEVLAFGVHVYQVTASELAVALILFARLVPMLALGLFVGAIAERFDRRVLISIAFAYITVQSATLATLAAFGMLELWMIGLGAFLSGIVWSLEFPARRTIVAEVAGDGHVAGAMSLDASTSNATRMLGPIAGGALIDGLGITGVYTVGVVLYGIAALNTATLDVVLRKPSASRVRVLDIVRNGLAYIRTQEIIGAILLVTIFINLFGFSYVSMVPVIGAQELGLEGLGMGFLMSLEGLGALIGSLAMGFFARLRHFATWFFAGTCLFLIMIFIFANTGVFAIAAAALFVAGLGLGAFAAMQSTILMSYSDPDMRARVMGVLVVCIGAGPIGVLLTGFIASLVGATTALAITTSVGALAMAGCAIRYPLLVGGANRAELPLGR